MFALIKLIGYFVFSTLVLSIPINSKPLFFSVQQYSTPVVTIVLEKAKDIFDDIVSLGDRNKKIKNKIDKISSSLSGTVKSEFKKSEDLRQREDFFKSRTLRPKHAYDHRDSKMLEKILERE